MKQYKRWLAILALCALLPVIAISAVFPKTNVQKHRIAVIVKSTQTAFWQSVRAGVNAAAREYNLEVSFDGPVSEDDADMQNQIIQQAVADEVEAIVFSAIDYHASVEEIDRAAEKGIKIVVIDSDVASEQVAVRIGTDNYAAGQQAAQALLAYGDAPLRVGVVGFNVHTKNGQQRQNGFLDELAEDNRAEVTEIVNCASDEAVVYEQTAALLRRHPEINALAAFNEITTLGVGRAIAEGGYEDTVEVVGFDNNTKSVSMMENGVIDTLIVQNPFAIGYIGVEKAQQLLAGKSIGQTRISTEIRAVRKDTMFEPPNEQLLFSFTENVAT